MTPEFRACVALFRWVMVGGLCLRLTAGNVFCARSERKYPFFCLGRELWLKFETGNSGVMANQDLN